MGPGLVLLPPSSFGVLLTLVLVHDGASSAAGQPVARSYDGRAWEELTAHCMTGINCLPLRCFGDANQSSEVELPPTASAAIYYRLDRYFARNGTSSEADDGGASPHPTAERLAAKLLLQASFGPQLSEVRNASSLARRSATDGFEAAVLTFQQSAAEWVHEQMVRASRAD